MDSKQHKREIFAWTMYDWANSAFATTIMAAVLPVYYVSVAAKDLPENLRTSAWAYTTTIALLLVAVLGPVLGTMADFRGTKKISLVCFVLVGVISTGLLFFVGEGAWLFASILFIFGNIGFSGSLVFYDALLPHIASEGEVDQVSSRGYAMGYLGGGILLAVNLAMIMLSPAALTGLMTRLSFVTVAIWWLVFTLPLWRTIPEPPRRMLEGEHANLNPFLASFGRLKNTFSKIKKYKDLSKFILAFWLYNNGIGTIIFMASAYGKELKFSDTTVIGTLLMVQFVAMPFAILFGKLAKKMGTKRAIYLSLFIYTCIALLGFLMYHEWQFWMLGFLVATVQGGSQALSRSLASRLMPKSQSGEFYSFFSVSEKIAGTIGPLVFGLASQWLGGGRVGIISLVVFFIAGALLLGTVDEARGVAVANEEEANLYA